jgi:hypothetical protein
MKTQRQIMALFAELLNDTDLDMDALELFFLCDIALTDFHKALVAEEVTL